MSVSTIFSAVPHGTHESCIHQIDIYTKYRTWTVSMACVNKQKSSSCQNAFVERNTKLIVSPMRGVRNWNVFPVHVCMRAMHGMKRIFDKICSNKSKMTEIRPYITGHFNFWDMAFTYPVQVRTPRRRRCRAIVCRRSERARTTQRRSGMREKAFFGKQIP